MNYENCLTRNPTKIEIFVKIGEIEKICLLFLYNYNNISLMLMI